MSMTDPVGDLLTRIRNGQSARLDSVTVPASRLRSNVLDVLQREGYIRGWFEEELRPGVKELRVELKYDNGRPVIKEIKRVSTPGRRVYSKIRELPRHFNGLGIYRTRGPSVCQAHDTQQLTKVSDDTATQVTHLISLMTGRPLSYFSSTRSSFTPGRSSSSNQPRI